MGSKMACGDFVGGGMGVDRCMFFLRIEVSSLDLPHIQSGKNVGGVISLLLGCHHGGQIIGDPQSVRMDGVVDIVDLIFNSGSQVGVQMV